MVGMYNVLVTGSGTLSEHLVTFTRALGSRIMAESDLVLVTGGLKQIEEGKPTVDYQVVCGALAKLKTSNGDPKKRILTLLPAREFKKAKRFAEGKDETVEYSTLRSRRFTMVHRSNAVVAIEGRSATKENIDLAWTLGKPLLPVACTGGNAKDAWEWYGKQLKETLDLRDKEIAILDGRLDDPERVAGCCVSILRRVLRPRCFVAMKFENHPAPWAYGVIETAARERCYEPVRVDKLPGNRNTVDAIWLGIRSSDTFVADISGNSPNVFYELGIAHALRKDVIIVVYSPTGKLPQNIAFDISGYRVTAYRDEESLRAAMLQELQDQCAGSNES
jgi:predicted Rossmann-fold nucleotide-binding protein